MPGKANNNIEDDISTSKIKPLETGQSKCRRLELVPGSLQGQASEKLKGKFIKEKEQITTLNPTITSRENRWTEQQERKTERSLLFMIASGVMCQAVSHTGYS